MIRESATGSVQRALDIVDRQWPEPADGHLEVPLEVYSSESLALSRSRSPTPLSITAGALRHSQAGHPSFKSHFPICSDEPQTQGLVRKAGSRLRWVR